MRNRLILVKLEVWLWTKKPALLLYFIEDLKFGKASKKKTKAFIYAKIQFFQDFYSLSSFNRNYEFNTKKYTQIQDNTIITLDINTGKILKSFGANM